MIDQLMIAGRTIRTDWPQLTGKGTVHPARFIGESFPSVHFDYLLFVYILRDNFSHFSLSLPPPSLPFFFLPSVSHSHFLSSFFLSLFLPGINDIIKSDREPSCVSLEQALSPSKNSTAKNLTATVGSLGNGTLRSVSTLGVSGSRNRSSSLTGTLNLTGSLKFDVTVNQ